jgi:hypothetical protein
VESIFIIHQVENGIEIGILGKILGMRSGGWRVFVLGGVERFKLFYSTQAVFGIF